MAGRPPRKIIRSSDSMCQTGEIWSVNKYIRIRITLKQYKDGGDNRLGSWDHHPFDETLISNLMVHH